MMDGVSLILLCFLSPIIFLFIQEVLERCILAKERLGVFYVFALCSLSNQFFRLIHCGKCRGKRQTRVKIPGGDGTTITVPCICKCEAKAEEDRKKQEEARQELQRMERLRSASLIENRLKNANLATFQQTKDMLVLYHL